MKKALSALFILCFSIIAFASPKFSDGLLDRISELKGDNKTKSEEKLQKPKVENNPKLKLPDNPTMKARAEKVAAEDIPELMKRVDVYRKQIAKDTVGIDDNSSCWDDRADLNDLHLYVFISSSIPEETLKTYAKDMQKLPGAIMVMNGTVGGINNIMPTIDLLTKMSCGKTVNELQKTDTKCPMARTDINPFLFRAFNVQAVPAFVYSEVPYNELMQKVTMGDNVTGGFLKFSGDVSIDHALFRFEGEGVAAAKTMRKQLKSGGFYEGM